MNVLAPSYRVKAAKPETALLVGAYVTVLVVSVVYIGMIFRSAHLIGQHDPSIDTFLYAQTHTYVALVEIVLWTTIATAAIRFKTYASHIRHSKDGSALNLIADAMLISFIYAILSCVASTCKTQFEGTPYLAVATTIANLLPLAVFLLLSMLLFIGSFRLSRLVSGGRAFQQHYQRLVVLSCTLFACLVFPYGEYFYRVAPKLVDDDGLRHFALLPSTLVAVYLVPFAVVWLLGLLACLHLAKYAFLVPGKIYKPIFYNLYVGILVSYVSTYLIQLFYVSNLHSNRFGVGLVIIVGLIALLIAGYGVIYRGASQLYLVEQNVRG